MTNRIKCGQQSHGGVGYCAQRQVDFFLSKTTFYKSLLLNTTNWMDTESWPALQIKTVGAGWEKRGALGLLFDPQVAEFFPTFVGNWVCGGWKTKLRS
ncbi:MAG: hypothetical protein N3D11_01690 [Candidatus Sumerlaeia bacterium]|nr:hypothetical protein [Candidatus Sumerlaeia bacterium]